MRKYEYIEWKELEEEDDKRKLERIEKDFDLMKNELDFITIFKDKESIIRCIQIKLKQTKKVIVFGNMNRLDQYNQSYLSFKLNQSLMSEFKYVDDGLMLTNLKAITI